MTEQLNLYQRINEIRKSINYVKKDKAVSTGNGSYQAVTHDAVTGMVREHMVKFGVVCHPYLVASIMNPKEVNAQMEMAKQARYEATYDFTFTNIDDPKETLVIRMEAHAMDNADKAPGKALSYAKKSAVLKLFELESGDDEESRYQDKEEFNIKFHSEMIAGSETLEILEKNYLSAKESAIKTHDASGLKAINAQTVALKKELEAKK